MCTCACSAYMCARTCRYACLCLRLLVETVSSYFFPCCAHAMAPHKRTMYAHTHIRPTFRWTASPLPPPPPSVVLVWCTWRTHTHTLTHTHTSALHLDGQHRHCLPRHRQSFWYGVHGIHTHTHTCPTFRWTASPLPPPPPSVVVVWCTWHLLLISCGTTWSVLGVRTCLPR